MICPHGCAIVEQNHYGLRLYAHGDGSLCELMNRLDVRCGELAAANLERVCAAGALDGHLLRVAYSSYKISLRSRLSYLEHLCSLDYDAFLEGFAPVRLALLSEDGYATGGLYLMELYFVFCGITCRITPANEALARTRLFQVLGELEIPRYSRGESGETRAYGDKLEREWGIWKNRLEIPVPPSR